MTSVVVEVADVALELEAFLDISGYSSVLDGKVISLVSSDEVTALDEFSDVFEVVLLNLCTLTYLKSSGQGVVKSFAHYEMKKSRRA